MSNAKAATSKGSKKGRGEAPEPPALDASDASDGELARSFGNAWTVDLTRASSETTSKRAMSLAGALKADGAARKVLDALIAYTPQLNDADVAMTRESKTQKERETRKPWQSRIVGVGIVANALRIGHSELADAELAQLLGTTGSELARDEIVKALLGDPVLGTKPGALEQLAAFIDDPTCTDLALLRAGVRSLFTLSQKRAQARCREVLTAPDLTNPRSVWLAKIVLEQLEAHAVDVESVAGMVFPLIKIPKAGRGEDLQAAALRYAGLTRAHYHALLKYVAEQDDHPVLVDAIAERFYWASLGANGVKQEEVRPQFKALEKRYLDSGDAARAAVFTKLLAGLARQATA